MGLIGKTLIPEKINKLFKTSPPSTYSDKSISTFEASGGFNPEILAEKANFVFHITNERIT